LAKFEVHILKNVARVLLIYLSTKVLKLVKDFTNTSVNTVAYIPQKYHGTHGLNCSFNEQLLQTWQPCLHNLAPESTSGFYDNAQSTHTCHGSARDYESIVVLSPSHGWFTK